MPEYKINIRVTFHIQRTKIKKKRTKNNDKRKYNITFSKYTKKAKKKKMVVIKTNNKHYKNHFHIYMFTYGGVPCTYTYVKQN